MAKLNTNNEDKYWEEIDGSENVEEMSFNLHNFRHLRWLVGFYQQKNRDLISENQILKVEVLFLGIMYFLLLVIAVLYYLVW